MKNVRSKSLLLLCMCLSTVHSLAATPDWDLVELQNKARKGSQSAQFDLAGRYYTGNGFRANRAKAQQWLQQAAQQADPRAEKLLKDLQRNIKLCADQS